MTGIDIWRIRTALALAILYTAAGTLHLALPKPFLSITPEWVHDPSVVIALTGLCEIFGAVGLCIPRLRRLAGAALALYAICVFPANFKHAIDALGAADPSVWQWFYHSVRLPLQPVIVWTALFAGGIVTWPISEKKRRTK